MIEPIAAAFGWFVLGWACRGLQLERLGRNSNGNCVPLPPAPPYSSAAIARRGSNPPPPGRKPAPPAGPPDWRRSFTHECINPPTGKPPLKLRQREPAPPSDPPIYGWGPRQLNPPPPAPGMRREYLWSPTLMAECGGPCWEAQDPRCCDCGAMWRDVPICMDEGSAQRGNGSGGPTTPKPPIKPQPSGGRMMTIGYQPLPRSGRTLPPPREP